MSSMHMPWYARVVFTAGRPFVLLAALVMSVPGEIRMAEIAGWHGFVTWLMPVSVSAYAACAAVISEVRRRANLPGRVTATIGAGAALCLALSAQVVAHLTDRGYMQTSAILVAVVSAVPPVVVAHMLHMAATPAAEVTAAMQIRELELALADMAAELADVFDREGRALVSWAHGVKNSLDELTELTEELAEELDEELAQVVPLEPKSRRSAGTRQAIPLTKVKDTVVAMQASGEKVSGPTLASRLGCSNRSGYRYLERVLAA